MPQFPGDDGDEYWPTPDDFPSSSDDSTAIATSDPETDWAWADD